MDHSCLKLYLLALRYSGRPNTKGATGSNFIRGGENTDEATGTMRYINSTSASVGNGTSFYASAFDIDPSRTSNIYQDGLTEVRVNAVFGYMLIRYS